jgi:NitT/TauT family transport system substrate-binding protein
MSFNPGLINIGHLSTVYHTSFILMGTDWLTNSGINTRWHLFASGPDIVNALETEKLDIGYIGLPPAMIGIDRGVPIICVAGGHVEGTVLIGQKNYGTLGELGDFKSVLAQFKGKVIGSPPKGSIHDVIINNALKEAAFTDITVRNFAWTDFVLEALADGEIDAAVGTPPLSVAAGRACGAKIIIPPDKLWKDNPSYGIVIRKELLEYPDVVLNFLKVHERASNFIREKPNESAAIVSNLSGIVDREFVLDSYRVSPKYCAALSEGFVESTMAFVPVLHDLGYISRKLREEEIFEYRFIKKVHREKPHYNI